MSHRHHENFDHHDGPRHSHGHDRLRHEGYTRHPHVHGSHEKHNPHLPGFHLHDGHGHAVSRIHHVRKGETIYQIAHHELSKQRHHPSRKDVAHLAHGIIQANQDKYHSLAKHPERIKAGMELVIPHHRQPKHHRHADHLPARKHRRQHAEHRRERADGHQRGHEGHKAEGHVHGDGHAGRHGHKRHHQPHRSHARPAPSERAARGRHRRAGGPRGAPEQEAPLEPGPAEQTPQAAPRQQPGGEGEPQQEQPSHWPVQQSGNPDESAPPGRDSSGYVDPTPERLWSRDGQYHKGQVLQGMASVYWEGRQTANGAAFHPYDAQHITIAHKYLPFGTVLRLEANGRSILAEVTDRGPFIRGRKFDITPPAARALGISGLGDLQATILHMGAGKYHKPDWYFQHRSSEE